MAWAELISSTIWGKNWRARTMASPMTRNFALYGAVHHFVGRILLEGGVLTEVENVLASLFHVA